jgi:phosphoribosylaminoimidazole-succinocarboxamide synthase
MSALFETNFSFPGQTSFYRGKVRDTYIIDNSILIMIVSDRVSAFDVVLPTPIPYKGQVLNQTAAYFLKATKNHVPNWVIDVPDPNVTIGMLCKPYKVEMVIRGYLTGHAWRQYKEGKRTLCGEPMPEGMKENDKFPQPIITPTTKSDVGHDLDITRDEIIERGLVNEEEYLQMEQYTRNVFNLGTKMAAEKGLILVDTKYEFGSRDGSIYLIDEVHTPDSSRYFYSEGYEDRQRKGEQQKQLSKEFLRQWLMDRNFMGNKGEQLPPMDDDIVNRVSQRYIELYEKVTGLAFQKSESANISQRVENNILHCIENLRAHS